MSTVVKDLGAATAYGYAVEKGYTGTEAEFAELMASYATVGQTAVTAAQTATTKASEAATSATTATNKATEATTAATTATTAAEAAQADADAAALDASQALSAASTATTKATEATTAAATATSAASTATTAKDDAVSAKTAAQTAQTGAETAAASVSASAAQIQTNADDISELKEDFTQMESDGVAPSAEQILTDKGVTDSVPYHYRKTGGNGADRLYDQIVGGTVCFNQLVKNGNFENINEWAMANGSLAVLNNVATITPTYQSGQFAQLYGSPQGVVAKPGHKIFATVDLKSNAWAQTGNAIVVTVAGLWMANLTANTLSSTDWNRISAIKALPANVGYVYPEVRKYYESSMADFQIKNFNVFDLTAMFGTEIADYIYSLETANAGVGVAFFKSLFPNDYYEYNAGELKSVEGVSAHEMVGFNQWDEETEPGYIDPITGTEVNTGDRIRMKNYVPVLPNTTYYKKVGVNKDGTTQAFWNVYFDEDKHYIGYSNPSAGEFTTPATCHYIRSGFESNYGTTYNHDICINLSDPVKNGTYEPYQKHSYPLDSTLTLRGLFKLDANNNLYADGDTYEYTGKVTRNTILRAYQSGDESLANAITDGTNTVVYSANASTEQATPYQHLQQCDPDGTEEYVSTGIVPIGHNSFYPENLRAKIEQLPWNFSSLIAPTESTFTATRNYTTGALFIVSNVLYKATSNIANGGTITPNTNCTATTLAEIISALA